MKFWISKNSEVPIREQLVTQITLGIASGELGIGSRLPSTREIALRYKIHSNTVSHAYQQLAENGWLDFRRGSGFYVRDFGKDKGGDSLDRLIAQFVVIALNAGFSRHDIKERLLLFVETHRSNQLCVLESDVELREILIEEIRAATDFRIVGAAPSEMAEFAKIADFAFTALLDEKEKLSTVIPPGRQSVFLKARSAAAAMTGETRPGPDELIAIVSGWPKFLILAKIMLLAAKVDPESLLIRSTTEKNWRRGANAASMIICDSLTARKLDGDARVRVFPVISDDSLEELGRLLDRQNLI